ncbi:MAG: DMT family transporter [Rhizobiaceae bacterium]|nr:DMT family transporter [Rhizobiaceae bacterium]
MSARRFVPALFVVIWATGFIGARYAMPHAEPFAFLAARFGTTFVLFVALAWWVGSPRLPGRAAANAAGAGALIHGLYLGGVFWAVDNGLPAGLTALIIGLQPLLTAILAGPLLGEKVLPRHWAGIAVGLAGLALVLGPRLGDLLAGVTAANVAACAGGALAIALGTIWQKKTLPGADLVAATKWQYLGATIPMLVLALIFETFRFDPTPELIGAFVWSVLVLSMGAILLLMLMMRDGAMTEVASLFYLVPAVTALMAFALFGERLSGVQLAGMAVTMLGVWLATRRPRGPAEAPSREPRSNGRSRR